MDLTVVKYNIVKYNKSNKSLYSMQFWARYFKKVISSITSYFSQIVTELHHYKIN